MHKDTFFDKYHIVVIEEEEYGVKNFHRLWKRNKSI